MEEELKKLQTQNTELNTQLKAALDKVAGADELVTKARKEEKEKLYGEVTKFKELLTASEAKVKELEQSLASTNTENETALKTQLATKENEVAELNKNLEELNKKLAEGNENSVSKEVLEALHKQQEEMATLIKQQAEKIESIEKEKAAEILAKEVSAYKAEKVKDLDPNFHSFVQGVTKEDVDRTHAMAKTAYENFLKQNGYQNLRPTQLPTEEVFKDMTPEEMRKMSKEQWDDYSKKLREKGVLK